MGHLADSDCSSAGILVELKALVNSPDLTTSSFSMALLDFIEKDQSILKMKALALELVLQLKSLVIEARHKDSVKNTRWSSLMIAQA